MNLPHDQLTPYLYLSKVATFQTCPRKYYWQHHLWLHPKEKPTYFTFGSNFHHACIDLGLIHGWDVAEAALQDRFDICRDLGVGVEQKIIDELAQSSTSDRSLMLTMLDSFREKWEQQGVTSILSTEQAVKYPLTNYTTDFTDWVVKADFIYEDSEGVWVGDIKTTSGYGPATAKYYHDSPQTKSYFWILQQLMPNLRGTKIFVVTKQKVRCEVETILLSEADKYQAQMFVEEAVNAFTQAEAIQQFPRYMTACINSYGQECPYAPLCINPIKSEAYLEDLVENWYRISNPDGHLELEG